MIIESELFTRSDGSFGLEISKRSGSTGSHEGITYSLDWSLNQSLIQGYTVYFDKKNRKEVARQEVMKK